MKQTTGKIFQLLFIALCSLQIAKAQQPTQEWLKRYSDTSLINYSGTSIKTDNVGNIYILAKTQNFCFIKYDQNGNLLTIASNWPSGYTNGGGTFFDVTSDGDVYVTGDVINGLNSWIYTCKFNSTGTLLWSQFYNYDSGNEALDIKADNLGNVIIVGSARIININYGLIIKYNSSGDTLWSKHFNNTQNEALFTKFEIDNSNNIYITGYVGSPYKCLIMKYEPIGNLIWFNTFTHDSLNAHIGEGLT